MRYVAEAPLTTLRSDLGLPSTDREVDRSGHAKILKSNLKRCEDTLVDHEVRLRKCEEVISAYSGVTPVAVATKYIQNIISRYTLSQAWARHTHHLWMGFYQTAVHG